MAVIAVPIPELCHRLVAPSYAGSGYSTDGAATPANWNIYRCDAGLPDNGSFPFGLAAVDSGLFPGVSSAGGDWVVQGNVNAPVVYPPEGSGPASPGDPVVYYLLWAIPAYSEPPGTEIATKYYYFSVTFSSLPALPTGLTAPDVCEGAQASLSWNLIDGADSVLVYRDGEVIATLAGDATAYVATGLTLGQEYRFEVAGVNCRGEGPHSAPLLRTPCVVHTLPQGQTRVWEPDGSIAPAVTTPGLVSWDITKDGVVIATSAAPNGWRVAWDGEQLHVHAPPDAAVGEDYVARLHTG